MFSLIEPHPTRRVRVTLLDGRVIEGPAEFAVAAGTTRAELEGVRRMASFFRRVGMRYVDSCYLVPEWLTVAGGEPLLVATVENVEAR
jgi:hypothetical protein